MFEKVSVLRKPFRAGSNKGFSNELCLTLLFNLIVYNLS